MKLLTKTISPSSDKVFWAVLFILFINQFHRLVFIRPIWALFPEHYLIEFLFYLVIPVVYCSLRKINIFSRELLFPKILKLYFLLIIVNIITCYFYRGQSPLVSIYGWGTFFLILYYPIFKSFNYNSRFWEKTLLWLYCIFLVCYYIQYFMGLNGVQLFVLDTDVEHIVKTRIVRLFADGILSLGVFYCLNKWLTKHSKKCKYLFFVGLIAEMLLTIRTRWVALPIACIYFLHKRYGFSAKTLAIIILSLGLFAAILQTDVAQDRINYITEKSETQNFNNESYVRVLLIDYFLNDHFKSSTEHFLGSGMPKMNAATASHALSEYSRQISALFIENDFYCFDMGYIGLSWLGGIPFTLILIILQFCIFRKKVPKDYLYIGVWELYLLISGWFNEEVFGFTNMICQVLALTILSTVIKENSVINKQKQIAVV